MFDAPFDATYAWLGIALFSVVVAGVVTTLPETPPPDVDGVAYTVDSVADGDHPATAEHGLVADRIRLTDRSVALEADGAVAHATLHGEVTPAPEGDGGSADLRRVLTGMPPERVFEDSEAFAIAAREARAAEHECYPAPSRLTVRQVHYGEVHVTLVG